MSAKSTILAAALFGGLGLFGWSVAAWTADDPPQGADSSEPPSPARRAKDDHLRRIGRALQGHAATVPSQRGEGIFPAQALRTADRKPGLSWRVALLPYLDQEALYKEFHLDEPWDSPHNRQLIPLMPDVYQTPDGPTPPGETRIQALWGPGAVFNSFGTGSTGGGRQLSEIVDGLSETAMIGVADAPVTWTEPDDMAFVYPQYLPDLDASDPRGFALLMADGSIRFLPDRSTRPEFLAALLNPADQTMLDWSRQAVVGRRRPLPTIELIPSSPAPTLTELRALAPASPTIEARLGRLEEKMDRLLRKLEAAGDPGP